MRKLNLPRIVLCTTAAALAFVVYLNTNTIYPIYAETDTSTSSATTSTSPRAAIKEKIEERKSVLDQKREEAKARLAQRIDDRKETMASRAAMLKEKLNAFKDKRKAAIAERVNSSLNHVNEKRTTQMSENLNKMSEILTKIEAKATEGAAALKDMSLAEAALMDAKNQISSASAAVNVQKQKEYTITVTTEGKIGVDAKSARDSLVNDLKAVHNLIVSARQAVAKAAAETKRGLGVTGE